MSTIPRGISAAALLLFGVCMASAQTGSLAGTLIDQSGGALPGASATLASAVGTQRTTTGPAGTFRFDRLTPGEYTLVVLLPGFAPASRDRIVVGDREVTMPPIVLSLAGVGDAVVVSASRTESSLLDAPATMTVIQGAAIATAPSQNFGDLLRSVPGMNVIQLSARDVNVTSRQSTNTLATSQLALLDGRSMYLDFYGLTLWDFVPVNPDDIKQIEVVRGPASAVWGANALTGVVNIITRPPRERAGRTSVMLSAGAFDRHAGSTIDRGPGGLFSVAASTSQALNDRWSYRISAGYFDSSPRPRPAGQIPIVVDPRDPTGGTTVGGAFYPVDARGVFGIAYENSGTRQPKMDVRVDQELRGARVTYAGGVAGTAGTIYTGTGPFEIQPGSTMSYGSAGYTRGALKLNLSANFVDAQAPNQLVADPSTGRPIQLDFTTRTVDVEGGHVVAVGRHQAISYGGNLRRNMFDITIAPAAKNRTEGGVYAQDDIAAGPFRVSIGARVDKFGNLDDPVLSPRLALAVRPWRDHALRVSFNRAFRSPSTVNNFLDQSLVTPVDLSGLAPLLPPVLQPLVTTPFPLVVKAIGSELPIGSVPQPRMKQESLTAYEWAYTGTVRGRTSIGAAFYINDYDDQINFVQLPSSRDPYTAAAPPPGWLLPPLVLTQLAQLGVFLPRTAFTYVNLGPTRQKGVELSIDERLTAAWSAFANYSWQAQPVILDDADPFPASELSFPPTNRFNAGVSYGGSRFLGAVAANYADRAFWTDVLTAPFHGYTQAYTVVNGSVGVRWRGGRITTSVKSTNLLNRTVQQHVFGDLFRRSVTGEVKFDF